MAEFSEVMKQARRMCGSNSFDNCILPRCSDEMCIWEDAPAMLTDEVIAEIEAKTMDWAAKHPEPQYLTWREWQERMFPNATMHVKPCEFEYRFPCGCKSCDKCRDQSIPAEIAEKLGIKLKEA